MIKNTILLLPFLIYLVKCGPVAKIDCPIYFNPDICNGDPECVWTPTFQCTINTTNQAYLTQTEVTENITRCENESNNEACASITGQLIVPPSTTASTQNLCSYNFGNCIVKNNCSFTDQKSCAETNTSFYCYYKNTPSTTTGAPPIFSCETISETELTKQKCLPNISKYACENITSSPCKWSNNECVGLVTSGSIQDPCENAFNAVGCQTITATFQCTWNSLSETCSNFVSTSCSQKQIKSKCMQLSETCKWTENKSITGYQGTCSNILSTDVCQNPPTNNNPQTVFLNENACMIVNKSCFWKNEACLPLSTLSTTEQQNLSCTSGLNKYACISLTSKACAFYQNQCEQFNSAYHVCNNNLNKLACEQTNFPCVWEAVSSTCIWYTEPAKNMCSNANSQISCEMNSAKCYWECENKSTTSTQNTQTTTTLICSCKQYPVSEVTQQYWENWNSELFNFENQSEQSTQPSNTNNNSTTNSTTQPTVSIYMQIFKLINLILFIFC